MSPTAINKLIQGGILYNRIRSEWGTSVECSPLTINLTNYLNPNEQLCRILERKLYKRLWSRLRCML